MSDITAVRVVVTQLMRDVPPLEREDVIGLATVAAMRMPNGLNGPPVLGPGGTIEQAAARGLELVAEAAPELFAEAEWLPSPARWDPPVAGSGEPLPRWTRSDVLGAFARLGDWERRVILPLVRWNDNEMLAASTGMNVRAAVIDQASRLTERLRCVLRWQKALATEHPNRPAITRRQTRRALGRAAQALERPYEPLEADLVAFDAHLKAGAGVAAVFVARNGRLLLNLRSPLVQRLAYTFVSERTLKFPTASLDALVKGADGATRGSLIVDERAQDPAEAAAAAVDRAVLEEVRLLRDIRGILESCAAQEERAATVHLIALQLRRDVERVGRALAEKRRRELGRRIWARLCDEIPDLPRDVTRTALARHYGVTIKQIRGAEPRCARVVQERLAPLV